MNSLVVINICIVLLHQFLLDNVTSESGLGVSSCRYSGGFDKDNELCHKDVVKLEKLPRDCSAFVFDGVICNKDYGIVYRRLPDDLVILESLVNFEDGSHNVYLFYKHRVLEDGSSALFTGDFQIEAKSVSNFINQYRVKGLILDGIVNPDTINDVDFYQNFAEYVTAIKTVNPNLEIGFYLSARSLIRSVNEKFDWFDFSKMNDILDFYIIEFITFNECTDDFLHGGITPLASSDSEIMTLNKFASAFQCTTIALDKVYFEFLISPISKPEEKQYVMDCELSYNEYCENYEKYQQFWCVDNQEILYNKGAFAKNYSKGFVAKDIDLVDRDDKCQCDDKYITFTMLLNGFNENNQITCDAFKIL